MNYNSFPFIQRKAEIFWVRDRQKFSFLLSISVGLEVLTAATMNNSFLAWNAVQLGERQNIITSIRLLRLLLLVSCFAYSSSLTMEVVRSSEIQCFLRSGPHYTPEEPTVQYINFFILCMSSIFWGIIPSSTPARVNQRFRWTYHLHLGDQGVSQQAEPYLLPASCGILHRFLLSRKWRQNILRNVGHHRTTCRYIP
jgi:hypothetical protein